MLLSKKTGRARLLRSSQNFSSMIKRCGAFWHLIFLTPYAARDISLKPPPIQLPKKSGVDFHRELGAFALKILRILNKKKVYKKKRNCAQKVGKKFHVSIDGINQN